MAEDDEIDILGDFSVDSFVSSTGDYDTSAALGSQSSELLTCDYTTPLYLDSSTSQSLLFSNGNPYFSSELQSEQLTDTQQEKNSRKEFTTANDSSGWTVKEKGLLYNGVQIFGKNNVCLAKFIGSKSADEVKFYLRHFYHDSLQYTSSDFSDCEIKHSSEIPTSIEEVIESVSTAKPTVTSISPKRSKAVSFNRTLKNSGSKNFKKKALLHHSQKLLKKNNKLNVISLKHTRKSQGTKIANLKAIDKVKPCEKIENVASSVKHIHVPSEEVVKIQKINPEDTDSDVDVDIDIESFSEEEYTISNGCRTNNGNLSNCSPKASVSMNGTSEINTNNGTIVNKITTSNLPRSVELNSRKRFKRKFANNGEGGKTLTHGKDGEVIHTIIVDESTIKKTAGPKKSPIRLIFCRPFNEEYPQPFNVVIHISALLLMDLHAHTCFTEVMGLVGGTWNHKTDLLTVTAYQPCRNTANSATHCDMCPITQAKAAENIHAKGLEVIGWFHSHPTFSPEPSQQDIDTQVSLQQWIGGGNRTCLGIILTPYQALAGATAASNVRCLIVDEKKNLEDQFVPYKFKTRVFSEGFNLTEFLEDAKRVVRFDRRDENENVFFKDYFLDNSMKHIEKFINSVKMHLVKCEDINKMTCDAITHGLTNIIGNY